MKVIRVSLSLLLIPIAVLFSCLPENLREPEPFTVKEVPRPALVDGAFPVAEARITEAPRPERFDAPLPTTIAEFQERWNEYPGAHIRHGLCSGRPEIVDRFRKAVTSASEAGASADELRATYGKLLEWCYRPEMCDWTTQAASDGEALREVVLVGLVRCGRAVERWFESGEAPADLVIEYWSSRYYEDEFEPRFVPAVAEALRQVTRSDEIDPWALRRGAMFLANVDAPESAEFLLDLYRSLPAGDARDAVTASLGKLSDPVAKEIFRKFCARPGRKDALCTVSSPRWEDQEDEPPRADCIGGENLRQQLESEDGEEASAVNDCLLELAAVDRAAAVAQAERLSKWALADPWLQETVSALVAYPEEGAMRAKLESLGLLHRGPLAVGDEWFGPAGVTPRDVLMMHGPVHCFDVETGMYPNEHDALLYELAELAGEPFTSIAFEETAPPAAMEDGTWLVDSEQRTDLPDGVAAGDPYRINAYLDGRAWQVEAQDFGDWYDLDQVLGLLNAIVLDRDSNMRFTTLGTGDQLACVLVAPRTAILSAEEEGLIDISSAGASMESGKEFEEKVFEALRGQEQ